MRVKAAKSGRTVSGTSATGAHNLSGREVGAPLTEAVVQLKGLEDGGTPFGRGFARELEKQVWGQDAGKGLATHS